MPTVGVCVPDSIEGFTQCTTSCCPNRCSNGGQICAGGSQSGAEQKTKNVASSKANPAAEKLVVVKAEVR